MAPTPKDLTKWTRKEFLALRAREWDENIGKFDSLVILPSRRLHDSEYRCMDFVAVRKFQPFCRLTGNSDVIHLDGIGGATFRKKLSSLPVDAIAGAWSIDCLPTSGLLHLWTRGKLTCGPSLSSFEVFSDDQDA